MSHVIDVVSLVVCCSSMCSDLEISSASFLTRLYAHLPPGGAPDALRALLAQEKDALVRLAWDAAQMLAVAVRTEMLDTLRSCW
jgi:hypothetical protein